MGSTVAGRTDISWISSCLYYQKVIVCQNNLPLPHLPTSPCLWFLGPPACLPLLFMLSSFSAPLSSAWDDLVLSLGCFFVCASPEPSIRNPSCRVQCTGLHDGWQCKPSWLCRLIQRASPMPLSTTFEAGIVAKEMKPQHYCYPQSCPLPLGICIYCILSFHFYVCISHFPNKRANVPNPSQTRSCEPASGTG